MPWSRVSSKRLLFAAAALFASASCARHSQPHAFERLAILRFENLGSDPSADWLGRALAESVASALESAPGIYAIPSSRIFAGERNFGSRVVTAPGVSTERDLAMVAGANRIGYGQYAIRGGVIEARLTLEDPATGKQASVYSYAGPAGQPLAAGVAFARRIWTGASPRLSSSADAVHDYVIAVETGDPPSAIAHLEDAVQVDPDCGQAWGALAQLKVQQRDREGAESVLDRALAQKPNPPDRARLELVRAEVRGDPAARLGALERLSQLGPSDPVVWRDLGDTAYAAHKFDESASALAKVVEIEPDDVLALNQMGYARALAGDLAGAEAALHRYQSMRPSEANPFDSLGDVNLLSGRLKEAESFYLESASKQAHFESDGSRFKAAMARLLSGDVAGADALASRYLKARADEKDPAVDLRAAEWDWVAGRRKEACQRVAAFARSAEDGPHRELASRAYAEYSVWETTLGDRPAAESAAQQAMALAGPASATVAMIASFLAQPAAGEQEWQARANKAFPGPARDSLRDLALSYALLRDKLYGPAASLLEKAWVEGQQAYGEGLPVLLAWSYTETGRTGDAAPLLKYNPVPPVSGPSPFFVFYFPRLFYLRSALASSQSPRADAAKNLALFQKISGPTPLVWDAGR